VKFAGQVTDEQGGAIVRVTVTLVSPDGTEKTVLTDQQGFTSLDPFRPAPTRYGVLAKGFAVYESTVLLASRGQNELCRTYA